MNVESPITQEIINMVQAVIDAKALNISGIFPPPVNSVVEVYTIIASPIYLNYFRAFSLLHKHDLSLQWGIDPVGKPF